MAIITNLYFSSVILALIVFVDVLVKFKNSFALKFFFLLLSFSIAVVGVLNAFGLVELVYLVAFFKACMVISILNIFSTLYFPKFRKGSWYFSSTMLCIVLVIVLVNKGLLPHNRFFSQFLYLSVDRSLNIKVPIILTFIRLAVVLITALHIFYFWYVIYHKLNLNNIYYEKIRQWTSALFIMSVIVIVANIMIGFTADRLYWANLLSIFISYYLLVLILKRPAFLNTAAKKIAFGHRFNVEQEKEIVELDFLKVFQEEKYYVQKDATMEGLANLLGVQVSNLSSFIQKKYDMSFNDLVNMNRVNYFFEIVQVPAYQNFTIDALAREVGFSSRQHLNKPFKKFHGGNPSDLIEPNFNA